MFDEDFAPFMDIDGFAIAVTLNGLTVSVLFDDAYARGDVGPFGMASSAPTLIMPTFEVPTSPVGLPVVVKGISYTVAAHEPDGTGISRLLLELA